MPSKEKLEGHAAESNANLHNFLKKQMNLSTLQTDGKSSTKVDIVGISESRGIVRFSNKFASLNNTQVWCPTQKTLFEHIPDLINIKPQISLWLGSIDTDRLKSSQIDNWDLVERELNRVTQNQSLINAMMLSSHNEDFITHLCWIFKKKGGICIIDAREYASYVAKNAVWTTSRTARGESLALIDNNTGKRLFHLQRKGSKPKSLAISPMFHIHCNWPNEFEIYRDDIFRL